MLANASYATDASAHYRTMKSILLRVPDRLKRRLNALRKQGYTLNGYIVRVLEHDLQTTPAAKWTQKNKGGTR